MQLREDSTVTERREIKRQREAQTQTRPRARGILVGQQSQTGLLLFTLATSQIFSTTWTFFQYYQHWLCSGHSAIYASTQATLTSTRLKNFTFTVSRNTHYSVQFCVPTKSLQGFGVNHTPLLLWCICLLQSSLTHHQLTIMDTTSTKLLILAQQSEVRGSTTRL